MDLFNKPPVSVSLGVSLTPVMGISASTMHSAGSEAVKSLACSFAGRCEVCSMIQDICLTWQYNMEKD